MKVTSKISHLRESVDKLKKIVSFLLKSFGIVWMKFFSPSAYNIYVTFLWISRTSFFCFKHRIVKKRILKKKRENFLWVDCNEILTTYSLYLSTNAIRIRKSTQKVTKRNIYASTCALFKKKITSPFSLKYDAIFCILKLKISQN